MRFQKKFLPSKKFVLITGVIVVFVALFLFYTWKTNKKAREANLVVSQVQVKSLLENDTDNDGVRDWEEVLWGTDPTLINTFGEPDKTYIASKKEKNFGSALTNTTEETSVDALAKEFLATIVSLATSGTLTSDNIDIIAKKYSAEVGQKKGDIKNPYTIANLSTGGTETQYQKKLTAILAPYIKKNIGNELAIIQSGFSDDGVFTKDTELKTAGALYESLSKELLAMQVPTQLKELHLAFLNSTSVLGAILISIGSINTDPISAIVSFSRYNTASTNFVSGLENIVTKLEQDGIIK